MSFAKCAIYLTNIYVVRKEESLPTWERGLKHPTSSAHGGLLPSLPTWERGLKLCYMHNYGKDLSRSPRGSVD